MLNVGHIFMSTHFFATPLGKKQTSSSAMAGEDHDKAKVDPKNMIGTEYDDVLEDKRQALEAYIKEYEVDCKRRMASCFGKARQGVV
jgi:hypothetical protein